VDREHALREGGRHVLGVGVDRKLEAALEEFLKSLLKQEVLLLLLGLDALAPTRTP
jgi:hypothetical protein